jgi:tRNA dimethylallyltransferase
MTGGTGLYFRAVNEGLDEMPAVPPAIREELMQLLEHEGLEALQKELREKDPVFYQTVDLQNPRRLLRALEIIRATGKPFSAFRSGKKNPRSFESVWFGLDMPRKQLYERINRRTELMIKKGLIEEVKNLQPYRRLNALQTVGYKELFNYLDGKYSLDTAVEEIKKNTRRYAKRQLTWFRRNKKIHWLDATRPEDAFQAAYKEISRRLASTT